MIVKGSETVRELSQRARKAATDAPEWFILGIAIGFPLGILIAGGW